MTIYRILIVDDQREVSRMLHAALETLDEEFSIISVPSAEEGYLEARLGRFDLLISDLRLPGMSGLELIQRVRLRTPELKVILMTGMTDPHSRRSIADAGANAFFYKPIAIPEFLDMVEQVLGLLPQASQVVIPSHLEEMPVVMPAEIPSDISPEAARAIFLEEEPQQENIASYLTKLRQDVNAKSVLMLNDRGQVIIKAGEIPVDNFESAIMPALMAAFSAGQKVSLFLGQQAPRNQLTFGGTDFDFVLAAVGLSYGLLVIGEQLVNDQARHQVITRAVNDLLVLLVDIGVPVASLEVASSPPFTLNIDEVDYEETHAQEDEALIALFDEVQLVPELVSADDFWSATGKVQDNTATAFDSGVISYKQALQLGLAPEEDEEEA